MIKFIVQVRKYYPEFTESELYLTGERFCWVLEDKQQPHGVKVDGQTCIPEGIYDVSISMSTRFKKDMLLLSNQADKSIQKHGIRFDGIRPHGGNVTTDTEGCPLVAFQTDHKGKVWESASAKIFAYVQEGMKEGYRFKWVVTS